MSNLDKIKEKKENIEKKLIEKKEHLEKKIKEKEQKIRNHNAKQLKDKSKKDLMPAMFEMLIVIVNRGRGQAVLNYLKSIDVNINIVSFGEGTAPSNIASLLGFNQEKEVLFSVVNLKDSEKVLDLLDSIFLSTEKYSGIACTIPLKSMTNVSLDTFKNYNSLSKEGGKQ